MADLMSRAEPVTMPQEQQDLALHVQMCERRHQAMHARTRRIELAVYAILAVLLSGGYLTVEQLRGLVGAGAQAAAIMHGVPLPLPPAP